MPALTPRQYRGGQIIEGRTLRNADTLTDHGPNFHRDAAGTAAFASVPICTRCSASGGRPLPMTRDPLFILAAIACLAVVAVLLVGIGGFARGGDFNRKYANKIMRLRLLAQFIAIVLIVVFVWVAGRG